MKEIMDLKGIIRIGTSGIVLPGPKQTFPEEFQSGSRLHYYSSLFNTLEINSTFYKVPLPTTFKRWSEEVPENFKFTAKLWRQITHARKLEYNVADIDMFMRTADHLGHKKGCLLIQFPASITIEYRSKVEKIIERVDQLNDNKEWRLSLEFRHASWYQDDIYTMIKNYNASLVFHDINASRTPETNLATAIIYIRFHGPNGDYKGSYSDELLYTCAENVNNWLKKGKDVYVYFNNTIGSALQNAQRLQDLLTLTN